MLLKFSGQFYNLQGNFYKIFATPNLIICTESLHYLNGPDLKVTYVMHITYKDRHSSNMIIYFTE